MTNTSKTMTLLVQRQLDAITTGNGAFLETFLRTAKAAGFRVRIVFAPWHAFGNRPFASIHPRLRALIDEVVWEGTVEAGGRYWSCVEGCSKHRKERGAGALWVRETCS